MIDVMINGPKYFDYSVNNDVRKIFTGEWDNYTNGCQLDFLYFKENYKVISIDLSKQLVLDADPRVMQKISFTGSLERDNDEDKTQMLFIHEKVKDLNYLRFRPSWSNDLALFTRNC